jgi:hypothetical protein
LHCDLIDLHIFLDHHFFEGLEVVAGEDLLDDAVVSRIRSAFYARIFELFTRNPHLRD